MDAVVTSITSRVIYLGATPGSALERRRRPPTEARADYSQSVGLVRPAAIVTVVVTVALIAIGEVSANDTYAGRTRAQAINGTKGALAALAVTFSGEPLTVRNLIAVRRVLDYATWTAVHSHCGKLPAWRVIVTQTRSQYDRARREAKRSFPKWDVDPYSSKPESYYMARKGLQLTCG